MTSDFDKLWQKVKEMGGEPIRPDSFVLEPPPSVVPKVDSTGEAISIAIELDQLDGRQNNGGLLSYQGSQVLVYIPDQGSKLHAVLKNPSDGTKFHVSHCTTLDWMAEQNRNHRYVATNDTSGIFELKGGHYSKPQKGRLNICKNCLKLLNYQGYSDQISNRNLIFDRFDLTQFFATFSSLFRYPYARRYRAEAQSHSDQPYKATFREPVAINTNCSRCHVSLPGNMVVSDSPRESANRQTSILCRDCDRREHWRDAEPIVTNQMRRINRQRREQGLLDDIENWSEALDLADPAFHGLMLKYQHAQWPIPEVGVPLTDGDGVVLETELGLAWDYRRFAVVASPEDKAVAQAHGWDVKTLGEAMLDVREDG